MNDINAWRSGQRARLSSFYDALVAIISAEPAFRSAMLTSLESGFAIRTSTKGECVTLHLVGDWIELDLAEANRAFHDERLARWRKEIAIQRSTVPLETDAHVVHMHLHAIHGDRLASYMALPIPRPTHLALFDELRIDRVSLALLLAAFPDALPTPAEASDDARKAAAEEIIRGRHHLTFMPGFRLTGNDISIDQKLDAMILAGPRLTIMKKDSDTADAGYLLEPGDRLAKAIQHPLLDKADLRIVEISYYADRIVLTLDRFYARNMMVLEPCAQAKK
jgi:hypothetical protein